MKLYETVVNLQNIHILSIHGLQINRFHRCLIWKVKMREWENDRKQQHFSGPCPQTSPNIPRPAPYLSQELGLGQVQIVHLQELDHDKVLEIHPTWRFRPRNSDSPSWRPQGKPNRAVSYHSSCPSQRPWRRTSTKIHPSSVAMWRPVATRWPWWFRRKRWGSPEVSKVSLAACKILGPRPQCDLFWRNEQKQLTTITTISICISFYIYIWI